MSGNGLIPVASASSASGARAGRTRVEKACQTSDLNDGALQNDQRHAQLHGGAALAKPSQSETKDYAPLWYGPRLRPAFVAQVIGQVMKTGQARDRRSVFAAYEDGGRATARMTFDRRI